MKALLVIGYGNRLRGDDGLGWAAADLLRERLIGSGAIIETHHQLTPEIADSLSQAQMAVFIDAREGGEPGAIHCEKIEAAQESSLRPSASNHQSTPQSLLELSSALYGSSPEAYLYSMGGKDFGYSETLSSEVWKQMPELVEQIVSAVRLKSSNPA